MGLCLPSNVGDNDDFTDSERAALREAARNQEHKKWLFDLLKRWATWITAVILGAGVLWDAIGKAVKALTEHSK